MARDEESFLKTINEAKHYLRFHNKPIWVVPTASDYAISVIKPKPDQLPVGTTAIQYDTNMNEIDSVKSSD